MPTSYSSVGGFLPTPPSGGGGSGGGGTIPPPPNRTQTVSQIQTLTNWIQPGNAGDTGGSSGKTNGTFVFTPGNPATFSADGGYPYNNGYWYTILGNFSWANKWTYHLEVQFPTLANFTASQAIEFELQQDVGGYIFNMAWQANFKGASKTWKSFTYTGVPGTGHWDSTGIPVDFNLFNSQQYCSIEAVYTRTANTTTHVSLKINNVTYVINKTRAAVARVLSPHTNAAFQLDSNSVPTPYIVHARNFNVIAEAVPF